ncbi:MAG: branched-chain amino acid ABC transporter permease [Candidatus Spyradocola sp.]|nr:branched-chain amino acid ABC transporter permease [Candidatus Spyradocola sp.]
MKKKLNKTLISYAVNAGLVVLLYVVMMVLIKAGVINRYYEGIVRLICINIIMAVSLNLVCGFMGQLALGHAGFMSVGAYAAALFTMHCGLPEAVAFPLGLLVGGIVAAIVGFLIGIPALRMRGDYLAIITLGFGEIIRVVANALPITGGAKGLSGIPASTNFSWAYWVMILSVFVIFAFIKSRHGRAVISIREDEIAAEASGIRTTYYKMMAFVLAAFFAGIAGGLYAHHVGVLAPTKFDFNYSVEFLVMVVLGGMGSITGSIIAAIVLTILPEALRGFEDYRMLLYSLVLIVMMLFRPTGLLGTYEFSLSRMLNRPRKAAIKEGGKQA